jgi:hypothetical protein
MLGLGLGISRLGGVLLPKWLRAFTSRVREDGGTTEAKKCVVADGEFLIENTRAGIIIDTLGAYNVTQGGDGLEARACSAQAVNDLLYDPKPQTRFLFRAYDEGTQLENYYCLSNAVDILEGDMGIVGAVTHAYNGTGSIDIEVKNGVAPYTYSWSNGATSQDITELEKGEYRVQVKDAEGAIANHAFLVLGNEELTIVTAGLKMDLSFDATSLSFPAEGSAEFNGTSDYILAPSPFSGNTTDFTISFWMNATADVPLGFGTIGDGSNYAIFYKNSNLLKWEVRGTFGIKNLSTTSNPYSENWEFIALSVDSSTGSIYVNGSKESEGSASAIFSGDLLIGRYGGGLNLDGNLANVAIWNRALHPDEINSIMWKSYSDLNAVDKNGLQAWYALDDITGTTVPDSTGNHNGTAN